MRIKKRSRRPGWEARPIAVPRRNVGGLAMVWLLATSLAVGVALFLANTTSPNQEVTPPSAVETPEPTEEDQSVVELGDISQTAPVEETTESEIIPEPEQPVDIPPQTPSTSPPPAQQTPEENPPEPVLPPVEIEDVIIEPVDIIDPPLTNDDPGPDPDPNPDPPTTRPAGFLAEKINLSKLAQNDYWSSANPQITPSEEIRRNCQHIEHIIHGCYLRQGRIERIYIIDTSCEGLAESTAVHELLHAIYSHLDRNKRDSLNSLITDFYEKNRSQLESLLSPYDHLSESGRINELHSFIGQSIGNLPTQLQQHYDAYFTDGRRQAIVYHQKYQAMLDGRRQEIKNLSRQISSTQDQIDSKRESIESLRQKVDEDLAWFKTQEKLLEDLRSGLSDPEVNEQYNRLVDEYNRRVADYRQRADEYNQSVRDHNRLVEEARQKVDRHNLLVGEINRINRGDCQGIQA